MAAPLPSLTISDVRQRVGTASFDRSGAYARRLGDLARRGRTLTATCQGTTPAPYDVSVTFGTTGIARADCSCPVGDGGRCKHAAALLRRWIDEPDAFAELRPVGPALRERSPEELVALVEAMVARHPDLRDVLEMPLPGTGSGTLLASVVRKQVRRAFAGDRYEWGSAHRIGRELGTTLNQAGAYVEHQDWGSAATVCLALIEGVQEHYETMEDHDGPLGEVVVTCAEHLGACLEHTREPDARRPLVEALFDVVTWDIAIGGLGLGDQALDVLKAHANDAERDALCATLERELARVAGSTGSGSGWRREALGGVLIELTPGELDDEAYLALCRASGRTSDLIDALLEMGRVDEAVQAAQSVSDWELVQLAPLFLHHGQGGAIDTLAVDRLGDSADWRLVDYVQERARAGGNHELALRLAERRFHDRPSAQRYAQALELARTLGHEDAVRARLREVLREGKHHAALTLALLHDGEPEAALKLVYLPAARWQSGRWGGGDQSAARLAVAKAVAETHPDDAVQIYLEAASDQIEKRGRSHYAEAARLLVDAREVHRATGRLDAWRTFIAELRAEFKGLPALRDELSKASL